MGPTFLSTRWICKTSVSIRTAILDTGSSERKKIVVTDDDTTTNLQELKLCSIRALQNRTTRASEVESLPALRRRRRKELVEEIGVDHHWFQSHDAGSSGGWSELGALDILSSESAPLPGCYCCSRPIVLFQADGNDDSAKTNVTVIRSTT